MTSSTKPEVHDLSQCRQRRIEPRPLVAWIERLVRSRTAVFLAVSEQTERQTDRHAHHNTPLCCRGRSNYSEKTYRVTSFSAIKYQPAAAAPLWLRNNSTYTGFHAWLVVGTSTPLTWRASPHGCCQLATVVNAFSIARRFVNFLWCPKGRFVYGTRDGGSVGGTYVRVTATA